MAEEFEAAVEDGLHLAKRIYFGKDRAVAPPKPPTAMERAVGGYSYLPSSPMLYAVISDPAIVDNPDMPSYQPYVHGRCDPPALIPLQMNGVSLEVDCYLDTAFVTVTGTWRVHCIMGSRACDCRVAIDGGTNVSVKLRWSQKLLYHDGELTLNVPFNFPEYVTPPAKKISKQEKIQLNVNSGPGTEILCKTTSHPLKVSSSHTFGGVLLNPPSSILDINHFCCYLFPGKQQSGKVFRREVVFVVDISASMSGKPLDNTKNALFAAFAKLDPEDSFNVIAFNGDIYVFSSSLELATAEGIEKVTQWINVNFVTGGGTNILLPLNQAIKMLSDSCNSIPIIFLITDGAVEDERHICDTMKSQFINQKNVCPRIYTMGIGTFCNHYFLRMLATISHGHHDAVTDVDSIEVRMGGLFARASSISVANIAFENLDTLDDLEVFPSQIPDLSYGSPLIVSGKYHGTFPETLKVKGILPDMSSFSLDLKVHEAKEIPIGKILAKQQIELLTAQAWYSENKELEDKVAKMSVQYGIVSEYTNMVLLEIERGKTSADSITAHKVPSKVDPHNKEDSKPQKMLNCIGHGIGFGNLSATVENIPPGFCDTKPPDGAEIFAKAASNCCGKLCSHCCCMCCIKTCSRMNDQCAIVLTQLFGSLVCLGCFACCGACCGGQDG
ncbi:hypothetical protein BUALT_Bualt09G0042400 [Buddleja alternifolia]|uniref:VWFA domain-containing protein n=1 Tax=Buddleja alternifolia TaxID=168488 RepID=A0AAV6X1L7_9LAMI|nr:hypothetical protein BUALT_Bualt09G0042400 [Buddleja alternifolia]